ncbi:hypothetical protein KIN13_12660, partial [Vibrio cholerae]
MKSVNPGFLVLSDAASQTLWHTPGTPSTLAHRQAIRATSAALKMQDWNAVNVGAGLPAMAIGIYTTLWAIAVDGNHDAKRA